MLDGKYTIEKR